MLRRLIHALFYEIIARAILIACTLFITSFGTTAPVWVPMAIGLSALIAWSVISVYAILLGADLIGQ